VFSSYNIYRGTAANGLQFLTSISSGNNSYTDVSPPTNQVYYQVEAVNPNGCSPSRATDYSSSKSNIIQTFSNSINEVSDFKCELHPNPAMNSFSIKLSISKERIANFRYVIFNTFGQEVNEGNINSQETKVGTDDWGLNGVYFVYVLDKELRKVGFGKLVIQK
jgi:hypothetical protein